MKIKAVLISKEPEAQIAFICRSFEKEKFPGTVICRKAQSNET